PWSHLSNNTCLGLIARGSLKSDKDVWLIWYKLTESVDDVCLYVWCTDTTLATHFAGSRFVT
ncbi:hypothetical protein HAX54_043623, partial [Datura stramonium]|nr:hypothetical protein [Datura stramonium]